MALKELDKGVIVKLLAHPDNDIGNRNGFAIANYKLCQVFQVSIYPAVSPT